MNLPPMHFWRPQIYQILCPRCALRIQPADSPRPGFIQLVDIDGPFVTIALNGRFWHKRTGQLRRHSLRCCTAQHFMRLL